MENFLKRTPKYTRDYFENVCIDEGVFGRFVNDESVPSSPKPSELLVGISPIDGDAVPVEQRRDPQVCNETIKTGDFSSKAARSTNGDDASASVLTVRYRREHDVDSPRIVSFYQWYTNKTFLINDFKKIQQDLTMCMASIVRGKYHRVERLLNAMSINLSSASCDFDRTAEMVWSHTKRSPSCSRRDRTGSLSSGIYNNNTTPKGRAKILARVKEEDEETEEADICLSYNAGSCSWRDHTSPVRSLREHDGEIPVGISPTPIETIETIETCDKGTIC